MRIDSNNHIWLDIEDLKSYNLYRSYEHWVVGRVKGVVIVGREVMYESMPKRSQAKVSRQELLAHVAVEEAQKQSVQAMLPEVAIQSAVRTAVDDGFRHFYPHYSRSHASDTAMQLAKAAAVLQAVGEFIADPKCMGSLDKGYVIDTFFEKIRQEKLKYMSVDNAHYFKYKVVKPLMGGKKATEVVKQPRKGNKNAQIATKWHLYAIRRLYADPKQYTKVQVANMLNWIIEDTELDVLAGYKRLSERSVQHLINQQMENEVSPWRMGWKHYNDHERGYISRQGALFPGDLWVIDGTKIQRMYQKDGRIRFAYRVFVIDAYSKAIIGSYVLPEGTGENRWAVAQALKMAVKYTGYLPAELLTDNSSAVKSAETSRLLERLELRLRHSKVGNGKDKIIERIISTVQTRCDKLYENNIGEGVRSRRKGAHTSPEHQAAVIKQGNIPSFEGLVAQEAQEMVIYNGHKWDGKASCIEKLRKEESPNVIRVEQWEVAQLFWLETQVTVRSRQISFDVEGETREYWIWENSDAARLNNTKVRVKYDLHDKAEVYVFDMTGENLECVCKPKKKPHMATVNQDEADREMYIRQTAHLETYRRHLEEVNIAARLEGEAAMGQAIVEETGLVLTEAEVDNLILYPFTNVRDVSRRFKNDIEAAESKIMTAIMLDEHGIVGIQAPEVIKNRKAMNPLEDDYVRVDAKKKPDTGNVYYQSGDMSEL